MNGIQKLSYANDAELMKCGFLSKKFYFLKENVRTYLIGFSVLHFAKENWILCKSAELVKLGISIYFWLGNSSKKSRLAFFSSFKILLLSHLKKVFLAILHFAQWNAHARVVF